MISGFSSEKSGFKGLEFSSCPCSAEDNELSAELDK